MQNSKPKETEQSSVSRQLSRGKIFLPVVIGLGLVGAMLYYQLKDGEIPFDAVNVTTYTVVFLIAAAGCMMLRDIGYMIRLRILSEGDLTWRQAFRTIMLWEFASAISPSAVGGSSVAVIFVHKEGISIGRSSAIVMATIFLDELYFILMFPLMILIAGPEQLFTIGNSSGLSFANQFFYFAVFGYSFKVAYNTLIAYGLFKNPHLIKRLILKLFGFRFLRRWRKQARRAGMDLVSNSADFRKKNWKFWLKSFGATFMSWTARYWVVNAIFLAFFVFENSHLQLFARQLVMWIMMLVSPTPGGSGFSEFIFSQYLSDFMPQVAGIAIIMAFIWRLFTYYPYFIAGVIIVPRWLRDKFGKKKTLIK